MEKNSLSIGGIPSILWGPAADKLLVAVHGNQSNKEDTVIEIVACISAENGCRVLSFDLPEHGDRKGEARLCDAKNCADDLRTVMEYARTISDDICLFGCSVGAYYSMLAYQNEQIQKALFLSPVVDMKRLIRNMMVWFDVSEERLRRERQIETPINTLYWHDYRYVLDHPVKWDKPTALLCGEKDELCEYEAIKSFAKGCDTKVTVMENGEHFFHTKEQLTFFKKWLQDNMTA